MTGETPRLLLWAAAPLLLAGWTAGTVNAGDDPPEGPPWVRSYEAAQADAVVARRPIFVYFTKTY